MIGGRPQAGLLPGSARRLSLSLLDERLALRRQVAPVIEVRHQAVLDLRAGTPLGVEDYSAARRGVGTATLVIGTARLVWLGSAGRAGCFAGGVRPGWCPRAGHAARPPGGGASTAAIR